MKYPKEIEVTEQAVALMNKMLLKDPARRVKMLDI